MTTTSEHTSEGWLRATVAASAVGTLGSLLMAVAHAGVEIPLFSAIGPGGGVVVPPAAAGFAVGAALYALVTFGLARRRPWSWPVGLVVNGLTLVSAAFPFRGVGSVLGIVLGAVGLGLLLSRPVRAVLLPRPPAA